MYVAKRSAEDVHISVERILWQLYYLTGFAHACQCQQALIHAILYPVLFSPFILVFIGGAEYGCI